MSAEKTMTGAAVNNGRSPVPIVLLAAGEGRRLGQCKPLALLDGQPLLERAIRKLRPLSSQLIVVLGAQSVKVQLRSRARPHRWVVNPDWERGQSTSLQAGLAAVSGGATGALVCLVDQPGIPDEHYARLLRSAAHAPGQVAATRAAGRVMVPAYLPRALWPGVFVLSGDQGARAILDRLGNPVVLECEDAADDLDTPADLLRHRARVSRRDD